MSKLIKISLFLTVGLVLLMGSVALAQDNSPAAANSIEVEMDEVVTAEDLGVQKQTLLPNSKFYFLKDWSRKIRETFTFNPIKKMQLKLQFSSEKLLEAKEMAEKTDQPKILKQAAENYEKDINEIKEMSEKIEGKAEDNPKVATFLDKYIKDQILHQKMLGRLERKVEHLEENLEKLGEKLPEKAAEVIEGVRERQLEKIGQVMEKLENKENITQRLEKNIKQIQGSEFKEFKNMEILKRLEEKVPERIREEVQEARGYQLQEFKIKVEQMAPQVQEKLKRYAEEVEGIMENKVEILEDIKQGLKETRPEIRERLEDAKDEILERAWEKEKMRHERTCPLLPMVRCPGRIVVERNVDGCPMTKCIMPREVECHVNIDCQEGYYPYKTGLMDDQDCPIMKCVTEPEPEPEPEPGEEPISPERPEQACITLWDPVCGKDNKTYSNKCFARIAGVEIAYEGACRSNEPGTIGGGGDEPRPKACATILNPVCGKDGKTYSNKCFAEMAGVEVVYEGKCRENEVLDSYIRLPDESK